MAVVEKEYNPSVLQEAFFEEVRTGKGNVNLIAVAGSGKSTTVIEALPFLPAGAKTKLLSFGNRIVEDLKAKVKKLEVKIGYRLPNVWVQTFHGVGFSVFNQYLKSKGLGKANVDGKKGWRLLKENLKEEEMFLYAKFVNQLVGFAKSSGIGIPGLDELRNLDAWYEIIEHHGMVLEHKEAKMERAIAIAQALMALSMKKARDEGWIDFDDMLYMPLYLNLRFWPEDYIFCDEAQDMNRLRRMMVQRMCNPRTRCFFVGDPKQAIFGFTGATNDSMNVIKEEFNCKEMMLNVSYRCPKNVVAAVKELVPYFEVHESNVEGDTFDCENLQEAMDVLTEKDAVLCRNVAPLVSLAFKLIAKGRSCHVLGREIGEGLISLVKRFDETELGPLAAAIEAWRMTEMKMFLDQGKEDRAAGVSDRADCLLVMIENLPMAMQSADGLIDRIGQLFTDGGDSLCLSSIHKAKGREWMNVLHYAPERLPSPWAKKEWQIEAEDNLRYVDMTRAVNINMTLAEIK